MVASVPYIEKCMKEAKGRIAGFTLRDIHETFNVSIDRMMGDMRSKDGSPPLLETANTWGHIHYFDAPQIQHYLCSIGRYEWPAFPGNVIRTEHETPALDEIQRRVHAGQ